MDFAQEICIIVQKFEFLHFFKQMSVIVNNSSDISRHEATALVQFYINIKHIIVHINALYNNKIFEKIPHVVPYEKGKNLHPGEWAVITGVGDTQGAAPIPADY